ncbi:MAG TPA: hypothetical protein VF573_18270 [Paraburkholderia sp.]|uniref:hypothetical protein n=1 Tax=Paraburkholderia sp. TaxID=1926495 RepID=UPI002ED49A4D
MCRQSETTPGAAIAFSAHPQRTPTLQNPRKKSPYHKDTGIPELLLPRCANGVESDRTDALWFPDIRFGFLLHDFLLVSCPFRAIERDRLTPLNSLNPTCSLA